MKRFVALAAVLLSCSACLPERATLPGIAPIPARAPDADTRKLSESEKIIIRRAVLGRLPNPDFAEFRWARFPKSPAQTEYYCGQLNAQTEPGRWVGFRPFVATIETRNDEVRSAALVDLSSDRIDVEGVVNKCREHGLDPFAAAEGERSVSVRPQNTR